MYCVQGLEGGAPGGVLFLDPYSGDWHWLINNWFGLHFNSPNDVITTSDGALWFTDPSYGSNQVSGWHQESSIQGGGPRNEGCTLLVLIGEVQHRSPSCLWRCKEQQREWKVLASFP